MPRNQNGKGDRFGCAAKAAAVLRILAFQLSGRNSAGIGSEKPGTCRARVPNVRLKAMKIAVLLGFPERTLATIAGGQSGRGALWARQSARPTKR